MLKSNESKRVLSILIIIITIFGWFVAFNGIGMEHPLNKEMKYGLDINGGVYVVLEADTNAQGEELVSLMNRTKSVVENRVNAMGISEANVTVEGDKKIRVELPGVEDTNTAIDQIGRTAQLQFLLADGTLVLDGNDVKNAACEVDGENGGYKITIDFTNEGANKFEEGTKKAANNEVKSTIDNVQDNAIAIKLDDEIISAPTVAQTISSTSCEITTSGGFTQEEATTTSQLIKGGALPVSMHQVNSSYQSATIGADSLNKAILAGGIGLAIVFLLMILAFGWLGLVADCALMLYVIMNLYVLRALGAVLTLPGIAGIILAIGMAVDANVIIFTRIREEAQRGKSVRVSAEDGFKNAMSAIMDGQVTTMIAAIVLYTFGTTAVRGFALTLMIGVLLSIFTAVFITRLYVNTLISFEGIRNYKLFGLKEDGTPKFNLVPHIDFLKHRKKFYALSLCIILIGAGFVATKGFNYGIDFTGGTMIEMDLGKKADLDKIDKALDKYELDETIVYGNQEQTKIILKTKKGLSTAEEKEVSSTISEATGAKDAKVSSFESFGPSVGKALKHNAVKSTIIAVLFMLLYIRIRFRNWRYGIAAVSGLAHDVAITLAVYGIFGLAINNPFIAGVLTVVGYSINDTIVIFDRIRENDRLTRDGIENVINTSINQTLSRSIMTSLTTLGAILPLFFLVSSGIREFTIPLIIGVLCGTYSSIFLCSPLLYELHERRNRKRLAAATAKKKTKSVPAVKTEKKALKTEDKAPAKEIETSASTHAAEPKAEIDTSTKKSDNKGKQSGNNKAGNSGKKKNKSSRPNVSSKKKKNRKKKKK